MKDQSGFAPILILAGVLIATGLSTATYVGAKNLQADNNPIVNQLKKNLNMNKETAFEESSSANEEKTGTISKKDTDENESSGLNHKELECLEQNPKTEVYSLTENQINKILNDDVNFEALGYRLEGGEVNLGDNRLDANIKLGNNREVAVTLVLSDTYEDGGKNFAVEKVESVGSNKLTSFEIQALKTVLSNVNNFIWNYIPPEYKEMFVYMQIFENSRIDVHLRNEGYLKCVEGFQT